MNTLYPRRFIVPDRLAGKVLISTAFLNLHVIAILCTEQNHIFCNGNMPISKQSTIAFGTYLTLFTVSHSTKTATREIEKEESLEAKKTENNGRCEKKSTCYCA